MTDKKSTKRVQKARLTIQPIPVLVFLESSQVKIRDKQTTVAVVFSFPPFPLLERAYRGFRHLRRTRCSFVLVTMLICFGLACHLFYSPPPRGASFLIYGRFPTAQPFPSAHTLSRRGVVLWAGAQIIKIAHNSVQIYVFTCVHACL